MTDKYWKLVSLLIFISGIASAVLLITFVIVGGFLDPEYNQVVNSISSLTETGAPNQAILQPLLIIFAPLYIMFSVLLVILFRKKANRVMTLGSVFLAMSAVISTFGFGLFPFEGGDVGFTLQNRIHVAIVITIAVILIAALILIAAGCMRTIQHHALGIFLWVLATIFTFSCGMTIPLVFYDGPFMGLVEKISVGTLLLYNCSLSIYFKNRNAVSGQDHSSLI